MELPDITVEEVSSLDDLRRHASDWESLTDRATDGGFFQSVEWTGAWIETFQQRRPLVVFLVRRSGRLIALLPMLQEPSGVLWRDQSLVAALNDQSPRGGILYEGDPEPVVRALLQHIRTTRHHASLYLPLNAGDSRLSASLPETARACGYGVVSQPSTRSPWIRAETGWDAYLKSCSKHARREWDRKRRRLLEAGQVAFTTVTDPREVDGAMADVLEIERVSWKEGQGSSFTAGSGLAAFYHLLARRCAERAWLRLHLLHLDRRPLAHVFAVLHRGQLLALKTSYDREYAQVSPGVTLMLHAVEQALGEGATVVDFLGAESRWKSEMATDVRVHQDFWVFARGRPECEGRLLLSGRVRPVLRRLPWLVRAKRRLEARLGRGIR